MVMGYAARNNRRTVKEPKESHDPEGHPIFVMTEDSWIEGFWQMHYLTPNFDPEDWLGDGSKRIVQTVPLHAPICCQMLAILSRLHADSPFACTIRLRYCGDSDPSGENDTMRAWQSIFPAATTAANAVDTMTKIFAGSQQELEGIDDCTVLKAPIYTSVQGDYKKYIEVSKTTQDMVLTSVDTGERIAAGPKKITPHSTTPKGVEYRLTLNAVKTLTEQMGGRAVPRKMPQRIVDDVYQQLAENETRPFIRRVVLCGTDSPEEGWTIPQEPDNDTVLMWLGCFEDGNNLALFMTGQESEYVHYAVDPDDALRQMMWVADPAVVQ
jgi:hypothetical protein